MTAPKVKGQISFGRGASFGHLPVGADGTILRADSSNVSGANWSATALNGGSGLAGFWIYGDGSDGSLTLVGPTTLAVGDSVKEYDSLTLAGFTLTFDVLDYYMVLYVKDTLSGGGGAISGQSRGEGTTNPGGAGGTNGVVAPGGAGGDGAAAIYVFAKTISTAVTMTVAGGPGIDGTPGAIGISSIGNGVGAAALLSGTPVVTKTKGYPNVAIFQGGSFAPVPGVGGKGFGSMLSTADKEEINRLVKDPLRVLLMHGQSSYMVVSPTDERVWRSAGGGGGGSGDRVTPGIAQSAGGGGGGGAGIIGDGGDGGDAVNTISAGDGSGGGAGGGGGGGGLAVLISDSVLAAVTVTADGGPGGDGKDGDSGVAPAGEGSGGAGGGGGGGGHVLAVVRSGSGSVTVTAVGGAGGTFGLGSFGGVVGAGPPGAPGSAGGAGKAVLLVTV